MSEYTFLCRTKTGAGINALEHLPFDLYAMGARKPFVIQDRASQESNLTKTLVRAFKESGMILGICPPLADTPSSEAGEIADRKTVRSMYESFTQRGFDAIIALGRGMAADMAKALNLAVSLGPDVLRTRETDIKAPLMPFVYLPTGMEIGTATSGAARFDSHTFVSPYLAPNLVSIDPKLVVKDKQQVLLDNVLDCLSICCEVHIRSGNPPARAYATTAIRLIMENLIPYCSMALDKERFLNKMVNKKKMKHYQVNLIQAAVMAGYLLYNPNPPVSESVTITNLVEKIKETRIPGIDPEQGAGVLTRAAGRWRTHRI